MAEGRGPAQKFFCRFASFARGRKGPKPAGERKLLIDGKKQAEYT